MARPLAGGARLPNLHSECTRKGAGVDGTTRSEVAKLAAQLGHRDLVVERTVSGRRFQVRCACGWGAPDSGGGPTKTAATFREAVGRAKHHLETEIRRFESERHRNGVSGGLR